MSKIDYKKRIEFPTDAEIEQFGKIDRGYCFDRTFHEHSTIEKGLQKVWRKDNDRSKNYFKNNGQGMLQDLLIGSERPDSVLMRRKMIVKITPVIRYVVATVIQWLGTNVGRCFLEEAFREGGYKLTYEKIKKE